MYHDILLSCLSLSRKGVAIKSFLNSEVVDKFAHPCERAIFVEIIQILNFLSEVVRFSKYFGSVNKGDITDFEEAEEYSSGYYIRSFAKGIEKALSDYYDDIVDLESQFSVKETKSLIYIFNVLEKKLPNILTLRNLINEIKLQKLHGCCLLQNINSQCEIGYYERDQMMAIVAKPVKISFFSHLVQWLLFGVIDDEYSEFFVGYVTPDSNDINGCTDKSSTGTLSTVTEEDIWNYEINVAQMPSFVSIDLAEKILYIGQTVLLFKIDRNQNKTTNRWSINEDTLYFDEINELWDNKEAIYCQRLDDLKEDAKIDTITLESIITDMKTFVSTRLSAIAVIEDDLCNQMRLIKDFYLLGRGEFYLEFLRQLYGSIEDHSEVTAKNYKRAFETASSTLGLTDDLEQFTMNIQKNSIDLDESCEFAILQNVHLKYTYKWPLNLLFSPVIVERYNSIFRFLLILRKLQYDLQLVWTRHKWICKSQLPVNMNIINFRNHLLFFINNLQYYIQVDVLESQFGVLDSLIKRKADFEEIQRAHSIFLANVLSQCFLLSDDISKGTNVTQAEGHTNYSIYGTLLEIFNICEKFSLMDDTREEVSKEVDTLEEKFNVSISALLKLLASIQNSTSFSSLSQFLLRLDYNRWYSAKNLEQLQKTKPLIKPA